MADMKDIYRVVKPLENISHEDYEKIRGKSEGEAIVNYTVIYQANLKRYRRKYTDFKTSNIIYNALKDGYVYAIGGKKTGITLTVNRKGSRLLAKKFYIFRVGLWEESLKEYETTKTLIVAIVVAVLGSGSITAIVTYMLITK